MFRDIREVDMLTTPEIVVYAACVPLLVQALAALAAGSPPPPDGTLLARYYKAEKHLGLTGNLFMVALCANGIAKLAAHFGLLEPATFAGMRFVLGIAFGIGLLAYSAFWVRAVVRDRRASRPA